MSDHLSNQSAIEFKNVSKSFDIWEDRPSSIKALLASPFKFKKELSKYQRAEILNNVSFQIKPGDFVGIMGRNGAGKSTLLKLISGIFAPTTGEVEIRGRIAPLLELGAGFSHELSGYENVFLNAAILGFSRSQTQVQFKSIVDFSELQDHLYKPVKSYSSGMLVRLGFSIAVHLDAPIFLFDEILAVGDVGFQKKCLQKIKDLHTKGKTIIIVTHNAEQVKQFCSRCILINEKNVQFNGDPEVGAKIYEDLFK